MTFRFRVGGFHLALIVLVTAPVRSNAQQPGATYRLVRSATVNAADHDLSPIGWLTVRRDAMIAISQPQDHLVRFSRSSGSRRERSDAEERVLVNSKLQTSTVGLATRSGLVTLTLAGSH